jgi:hypothetical protein
MVIFLGDIIVAQLVKIFLASVELEISLQMLAIWLYPKPVEPSQNLRPFFLKIYFNTLLPTTNLSNFPSTSDLATNYL